jgi:Stage II sporulation protein R (spore_II_R).
MKKGLLVIGIFVFYILIGNVAVKNNLIPEEAIRIRVIADNNTSDSQKIKEEIKKELEMFLFYKLQNAKGIEEAATIIKNSIPETKEIIFNILGNEEYQINYGMNYFPEKEYKGITYMEGYYKSLVVTLGRGEGNNWWCILFPPLCMLDNNNLEEVEYRSLVADIVNKYF